MLDPKTIDSAVQANGEPALKLEYWKRRLRELPDLRVEKVRRTRDALARQRYDREEVLDATVDRVGNELGVLCRPAK